MKAWVKSSYIFAYCRIFICFGEQHTREIRSDLDPVIQGSIDSNPDIQYRIGVPIVIVTTQMARLILTRRFIVAQAVTKLKKQRQQRASIGLNLLSVREVLNHPSLQTSYLIKFPWIQWKQLFSILYIHTVCPAVKKLH